MRSKALSASPSTCLIMHSIVQLLLLSLFYTIIRSVTAIFFRFSNVAFSSLRLLFIFCVVMLFFYNFLHRVKFVSFRVTSCIVSTTSPCIFHNWQVLTAFQQAYLWMKPLLGEMSFNSHEMRKLEKPIWETSLTLAVCLILSGASKKSTINDSITR